MDHRTWTAHKNLPMQLWDQCVKFQKPMQKRLQPRCALKFHTLIPKLHREVLVCCPCSVIHLTPAQVAQRLGMKERTLERWRNLGIGSPYLRLPAACVTASPTSRLTSAVTCAAALLSRSTDGVGAVLKPHASVATQPFAHPVLDFRNLSPFCCFLAARRWRALPAACG